MRFVQLSVYLPFSLCIGSSIYDIHKKNLVSDPLPSEANPSPFWTSTCRRHEIHITRAHSFPRNPAEFGFFPRIFEPRNFPRNSSFCQEFDVFHSNNYFFTENDLKVALLQVSLWWFFVCWWRLNDEIDD